MKRPAFTSTQTRLTLTFTLLFLVGVLILTRFLKTSADAMTYNIRARSIYTQARMLYQVKADLQEFEKSLRLYELTSDFDTLSEYYNNYIRLQHALAFAATTANIPEEKAGLEKLANEIEPLRQKFDLVVQAVDNEDWDSVDALDAQAYDLLGSIFTQIDSLIQARSQALVQLRSNVDTFASLGKLAIAVALPLYLVVVAVAAFFIVRQIHAPLIQMTGELKHIQASQFDPAALGKMPERRDEIGYLAREYLQMAANTQNHQAALRQEAEEIRLKIH